MNHSWYRLPLDDLLWEVLIDELQVVWLSGGQVSIRSGSQTLGIDKMTNLELLHAGNTVTLGVEVVRVESLDSLQHLMVLLAHELPVRTLLVPGVEAVVADHGESLVGQLALVLDDVVEVLVVAPAEHDVVEADAGRVDAELGAVDGVVVVRVALEGVRVDAALVEAAADGEGVADAVPLALREAVPEEHQLAQVVDQARQLHPARLAVAPHRLGALQQVVDLPQLRVRVALVDERVQLLHRLPDGHLGAHPRCAVEPQTRRQVVCHRLLLVLLPVEVLYPVACRIVVPELCLVLLAVELGLIVVAGQPLGHVLLGLVLEHVDGIDGV